MGKTYQCLPDSDKWNVCMLRLIANLLTHNIPNKSVPNIDNFVKMLIHYFVSLLFFLLVFLNFILSYFFICYMLRNILRCFIQIPVFHNIKRILREEKTLKRC